MSEGLERLHGASTDTPATNKNGVKGGSLVWRVRDFCLLLVFKERTQNRIWGGPPRKEERTPKCDR